MPSYEVVTPKGVVRCKSADDALNRMVWLAIAHQPSHVFARERSLFGKTRLLGGTEQSTGVGHYDAEYLGWSEGVSRFNALTTRHRFESYVKPTDRVVDFGCGPGYMLASLDCAERIGIEVNPSARAVAAQQGITCVASADEIKNDWANVVISNSALEHVENPLLEIRRLFPKVRRGGRVVFAVPHETLAFPYVPGDRNQHLYTWSRMTLGNLFATAGFVVEDVTIERAMWPPRFETVHKLVGATGFQIACKAYRLARIALYPLKPVDIHTTVRVIARRP